MYHIKIKHICLRSCLQKYIITIYAFTAFTVCYMFQRSAFVTKKRINAGGGEET